MKFKIFITLSILPLIITGCGLQTAKKIFKGRKPPTKIISPPKDPANEERTTVDEARALGIESWEQNDLSLKGHFGISANKAYKNLNLKQTREVIVAVIDSGVDIKHEDSAQNIWSNKNEIPGNGLDDDGNGYIDDIHGWNFIGGADGSHLQNETLEDTRILKSFESRIANGEVLTSEEMKIFVKVKKFVNISRKEKLDKLEEAKKDKESLAGYLSILKNKLGIKILKTRQDIERIKSVDGEIKKIQGELLILWDSYGKRGFAGIDYNIKIATYYVDIGYNPEFNGRRKIVGDDPRDFSDTQYGNNDVKGPSSGHGTHVAGTIAAIRNNKMGMNGIASNVKIMVLRAVPNGDERDKDIALSVRYAADNGAHIINMSFGKRYSPFKSKVDAAFKYAADKGVLIIHAAGNSAKNIDKGESNYPNSYELGTGVLKVDTIKNWIEVGASTRFDNINLVAKFSNFGNEAVHLFAPGHKIYSTTPENKYGIKSGTSMACPVTSGVAAALLSEFPTMTGQEARDILFASVSKREDLDVKLPSKKAKDPDFTLPIPFKSLSQTSGVINLFTALEFAFELSGE